ncbi:helix-turn-helix transcriptional regulator [bacterium]|nr:helix-turn-helix transcriptional regulator [bacterium]
MNKNECLGAKIKALRKAKNFSQEVLAEKADLSPRQVVKIENAQSSPNIQTIQKIASALGVSIQQILDNDSYDSLDIVRSKAHYILDKMSENNLRLALRILSCFE